MSVEGFSVEFQNLPHLVLGEQLVGKHVLQSELDFVLIVVKFPVFLDMNDVQIFEKGI